MPAEDERDRRAVLADAAIALVADHGMRGLTHRAVDLAAQMPQGTTSAYFRTRSALLVAVVQRLSEIGVAELARRRLDAGGPMMGGASAGAATPAALDGIARETAELIVHLTTTARVPTLARYICILETTHRPELHELLRFREAARAQTTDMMRWAGAPDPAQRARDYTSAIDGMILDRILDPPDDAAPPYAAVRRLLSTAVAPDPAWAADG